MWSVIPARSFGEPLHSLHIRDNRALWFVNRARRVCRDVQGVVMTERQLFPHEDLKHLQILSKLHFGLTLLHGLILRHHLNKTHPLRVPVPSPHQATPPQSHGQVYLFPLPTTASWGKLGFTVCSRMRT